ncbi:MAG: hypothetical protein JZU53_10325 [Paludibacter sp.]|nr:hypothetical protein [Paludibacter sp.]
MTKFTRHFIAIFFLIAPFSLFGKSVYSGKTVHISAGQVVMSKLLKNISTQTACVFSYDPVMINDKQIITVPTGLNCSLSAALQKLLPKNIQFRFKDKFIVLQRVSTVVKEIPEKKVVVVPVSVKSIAEPIKAEPIVIVDSTKLKPIVAESKPVVHPDPIVEVQQADTVAVVSQPASAVAATPVLLASDKPLPVQDNRGFGQFIKNHGIFEIEVAAYSKQLAGAVRLGLSCVYAILSIGTNADKARSSGVGVGAAFKVHKRLGLNLDILRLNLLSGQTYDLGVRTVITQFRPEVNYYFGSSIKLFVGPTFNMLNSTYVNSIKTYDLGKTFYYGGIVGVKVDLNHLFRKKS